MPPNDSMFEQGPKGMTKINLPQGKPPYNRDGKITAPFAGKLLDGAGWRCEVKVRPEDGRLELTYSLHPNTKRTVEIRVECDDFRPLETTLVYDPERLAQPSVLTTPPTTSELRFYWRCIS